MEKQPKNFNKSKCKTKELGKGERRSPLAWPAGDRAGLRRNLPEWGRRTTEDAYRQERSRRRHWPESRSVRAERERESERKHRTTDDGEGHRTTKPATSLTGEQIYAGERERAGDVTDRRADICRREGESRRRHWPEADDGRRSTEKNQIFTGREISERERCLRGKFEIWGFSVYRSFLAERERKYKKKQ